MRKSEINSKIGIDNRMLAPFPVHFPTKNRFSNDFK